MTIHVFVGPTLPEKEVRAAAPAARTHPPVAHGDLLRLGLGAGDVAVVIDGYYHHSAALRHKEILSVLAAGAQVAGCSSMGALRAAELHPFGMTGHGHVYEMYRSGAITSDDEVAVAHTEPPEYTRLSEPLVNIRYALNAALAAGALTAERAERMLGTARALHYTERSWRAVGDLSAFLDRHPEQRDIKAADAVHTLRRLPEPVPAGAWAASGGWRNRFLYDWEATFSGVDVDGHHVGQAAVAGYQQIYHPGFPARWRSFALTRIAEWAGAGGRLSESAGGGGPLGESAGALAVAEAHGMAALSDERLRHWLTGDELRTLPSGERLRRVLVRSYRPPRLAHDLVAAAAELAADQDARTAVAESYAVNARFAAERPGQNIERLKGAMLREHLGEVWDVDGDSLLAAARDRGFESVDAAVGALRPFFIRSHLGGTAR
ncbi:TfuA-like protein [Nonomuraea sp. NPDC002799]